MYYQAKLSRAKSPHVAAADLLVNIVETLSRVLGANRSANKLPQNANGEGRGTEGE
jgi:hypothetical protein